MKFKCILRNIVVFLNGLMIYPVFAQEQIVDSIECILKQSENTPFTVFFQLPEEKISFFCCDSENTKSQFLKKPIIVSSSFSSPSFDFSSNNNSLWDIQLVNQETSDNQGLFYKVTEGDGKDIPFKAGFIPDPFKSLRENPQSFSEGCLRIVVDLDSPEPAKCSVVESRSVEMRRKVELEKAAKIKLEKAYVEKIQCQEKEFLKEGLLKIFDEPFKEINETSLIKFINNMDLIIFTNDQNILKCYSQLFDLKIIGNNPAYFISFMKIGKRLLGRGIWDRTLAKTHLNMCEKILDNISLYDDFYERNLPIYPKNYNLYDVREYLFEVPKKAFYLFEHDKKLIEMFMENIEKNFCSKSLNFLLFVEDKKIMDLKRKAIEIAINILLDEYMPSLRYPEISEKIDDIDEERKKIFSILSEAWHKNPDLKIKRIMRIKLKALEKTLVPSWCPSYSRFLAYFIAVGGDSLKFRKKVKMLLNSCPLSEDSDLDTDKYDVFSEFYDILGEDHPFVTELEKVYDTYSKVSLPD